MRLHLVINDGQVMAILTIMAAIFFTCKLFKNFVVMTLPINQSINIFFIQLICISCSHHHRLSLSLYLSATHLDSHHNECGPVSLFVVATFIPHLMNKQKQQNIKFLFAIAPVQNKYGFFFVCMGRHS